MICQYMYTDTTHVGCVGGPGGASSGPLAARELGSRDGEQPWPGSILGPAHEIDMCHVCTCIYIYIYIQIYLYLVDYPRLFDVIVHCFI